MADEKSPPSCPTDDDRRQHLNFIQAVVTRMSAASATAKGWLLPVVTATYGYALTKKVGSIALLGIAAVLLFAYLDANYLRQEKAYRRLYDTVARGTKPVPPFTLNPSDADDPAPRVGPMRRLRQSLPQLQVWLSWSIAPFYGGFILLGALVFLYALT
jgi:hypothetical protein